MADVPLRVLLVEDSRADAQLMLRELRQAGFAVEAEQVDSEEQYLAALAHAPQVILCDYALPQFDALAALRILHEQDVDIPFIIVSGSIGEEMAVWAMQHGAADYLLKDRLGRLGPAVNRALEQHRLRLTAAQAGKTLRESEERLRQITENMPHVVVWMTNVDGTQMLYASKAYETIWGRTCASLYEKPSSWQESVHPGDRERLAGLLARQAHADGAACEYRVTKPGGAVHHVRHRSFPIHNATGTVDRIGVTAEDVTERKRLEEQFLQAQKMEVSGRLAGGIAHDFNNLLTIINGYSELLLGKMPPPDQVHAILEQIKGAGERAASLTRQLLAFSRQQVLNPCTLNLNDVVANFEKMLRRLIGEDIHLVTALWSRQPEIRADLSQIEQVLLNLAVNARDAMPDGGRLTIETVDIDGAAPETGRFVRLTVRDTGCGMTPDVRTRIFEPFFTTKDVGKGTGLGLATVFGIVQQSDGHITVNSDPGQGATFHIYLPHTEQAPRAAAAPPTAPPRQGSETILIAEDDDGVRDLIRELLEDGGYRVLEAQTGLVALEVVERWPTPIHLLLTDVVMPQMGGAELVQRLAPHANGLKVLYMSGYANDVAVRQKLVREGAHFLHKPFDGPTLLRRVREVLDEPKHTPAQV